MYEQHESESDELEKVLRFVLGMVGMTIEKAPPEQQTEQQTEQQDRSPSPVKMMRPRHLLEEIMSRIEECLNDYRDIRQLRKEEQEDEDDEDDEDEEDQDEEEDQDDDDEKKTKKKPEMTVKWRRQNDEQVSRMIGELLPALHGQFEEWTLDTSAHHVLPSLVKYFGEKNSKPHPTAANDVTNWRSIHMTRVIMKCYQ